MIKLTQHLHKTMRNRQNGMTLIEVLVALAVFAIVGITLLSSTNHSVQGLSQLEERSQGLFVADNQLTEMRLKGIWPETSWQSKTVTFGNRQWYVRWQGVNTPQPQLRAIDVEVSTTPFVLDSEPNIVASLRTYVIKQA
ncbi:type II secretion system minor pseudopilin GspI [Thorsellia anophelis]|uniref:Type II secretion system protein I n=1 Tax=Thorsellia anophelis DSM 18579 TaxID=1123402 RepID=A0A1I0AXG8_9GAMM|nr:type II secretion system minor pseudopilin GspI [Thorsellia anophelis]SES98304.1 general secretion pathway protein I [Thorsellia anophelis DSM 18579]